MFLACMLALSLSCVGLALVPVNAYWLLMLLRCIQAAGSASTIALGESGSIISISHEQYIEVYSTGAGVVGDVAARHERGKFFGVWNIGPMVSHPGYSVQFGTHQS